MGATFLNTSLCIGTKCVKNLDYSRTNILNNVLFDVEKAVLRIFENIIITQMYIEQIIFYLLHVFLVYVHCTR